MRLMTHSDQRNVTDSLLLGLVAGAAGTVALNIVTYADMALRGRASSSMPAEAAGTLAAAAGVPLGDENDAKNRKQGLGALLGYVTGLGVGAAYGLLRARTSVPLPVAAIGLGAAAMAGSDTPITMLGLTDPRTWPASGWASDLVPHLAYGIVAARAYDLVTR